ncbi:MAG: tRNA (adenosine(37)-N6)-threonylcarbamoyltransferase complex dimerization subunit type 1 TsaB [Flavobacteriales bacterium]|nr:tRNA (adenosine(37)-N6)-threonylcarbamoyltransferase complex dimerization subunit type 1 TsaB [Flavobacteriales bacterium]
MSLILGIETSTKMCSVAISNNEELLSIREQSGDYSHAELLNKFINEVCHEANIKLNDLDAVAVSKGPGSYTGLRIGVSAAKGLCYALDKPFVAVDTLKAMAINLMMNNQQSITFGEGWNDALFCPMIDARRMEVYTAVYNGALHEVESVSAKIIDEQSFQDLLKNNNIIFFGDGAEKCKQILAFNNNAVFINNIEPSAQYINRLALSKLHQSDFENVAYFEPYYLKDFLATTPKNRV